MPEPLEITLKFGEKHHHVQVKAGDADAAAEAKERVTFIIDLFAGTGESKKAPKPSGPAQRKDVPAAPILPDKAPGGAK